jgi:hypothetical protein
LLPLKPNPFILFESSALALSTTPWAEIDDMMSSTDVTTVWKIIKKA